MHKDLRKSFEEKMQRTLQKIKIILWTKKNTKKLCPRGLRPGLLYTAVKVDKLQRGEGLNEITIRPMTLCFETAA